jgi:hypothetical protein
MVEAEPQDHEKGKILIFPVIGLRAYQTLFKVAEYLEKEKAMNEEDKKAIKKLWKNQGQLTYGGAWQAWTIIRSLDDTKGGGVVAQAICDKWVADRHIDTKKWRRWLKFAIDAKWIKEIVRHRDDTKSVVYQYCRPSIVAKTVDCERVQNCINEIDLHFFLAKDPVCHLWAAYLSGLPLFVPISREEMRNITGVSEWAQRRYEKRLGITTFKHFAITSIPVDHLIMTKEFRGRNFFVYKDHENNMEYVVRRLPNSRMVEIKGIQPIPRPHLTKRVNREIRGDDDGKKVKLFHMDGKSLRRAERRLTKLSISKVSHDRPKHLFEHIPMKHRRKNAGKIPSNFWNENQL